MNPTENQLSIFEQSKVSLNLLHPMNHIDQEQQVILLNQGYERAFEKIFTEFSKDVFYYALRFIDDREEASHIQTDTFIKLWKKRGKFKSVEDVKKFLRVTVNRSCIDHLRHISTESSKQEKLNEAINKYYEEIEYKNEERDILVEMIQAKVKQLPKKLRKVIELYFFSDLKNPEIALKLEKAEKTVRNQKSAALKKLKISFPDKIIFLFCLLLCGF